MYPLEATIALLSLLARQVSQTVVLLLNGIIITTVKGYQANISARCWECANAVRFGLRRMLL